MPASSIDDLSTAIEIYFQWPFAIQGGSVHVLTRKIQDAAQDVVCSNRPKCGIQAEHSLVDGKK